MQTNITKITSGADMERLLPDWNSVVPRATHYSFAHTPAYLALAILHELDHGREVQVAEARIGDKLVGFWPFSLHRGFFREMRPVSCGSSEEYSSPLVDAGVRDEATRALLDVALKIDCDICRIQATPLNTALAAALATPGVAALKSRSGTIDGYIATLRRFPDWEAYADQASTSHLSGLRRKMRRLQDVGEVELGWCRSVDDARAVLEWAWKTKRAWAKARRLSTPWLQDDRVRDFFGDLAGRVDLDETPLVSFVKLDGKPIAAQINLIGDQTFEFFVTAYDDAYGRFSPGELLIEHSFRWAIDHKLDFDFRFLFADYKVRLSDRINTYTTQEFYLSSLAKTFGPLSRRVAWAARKARRAPAKALSLVTGAIRGRTDRRSARPPL